ncbi:MAG TPA: polysaccharide lyase 8 family protein [Candidatus Sulfotelmatobacter sp.]|nr:polysaccharide lyase 8 family protein [Candidatus Sulfotelmatobacter sp.]
MLKTICVCLLLAVAGTAFGYGILVDDTYSTGNRTNNTGNPLGLVYYMGQPTGTLIVTNDSAGIGSSNALFMAPAADWEKYLAYFGPVTLTNAGDAVTMSFDIRFTSQPTNLNSGFRCGLYNSMGTRQTTDASDTTVPGPGDRSDDVGYGFQTNPGTNQINGLDVYSEAAGNDILGGASPSQTANQGTDGQTFVFGATKHHIMFQIALEPNGNLALGCQIDGGNLAFASITAATVLTNSFDELCLGEGGTGNSTPWFIDNLVITTNSSSDYDTMRTNWWTIETGGTNINLGDSQFRSRLTSLTNSALSDWNSMDKTGVNTYLWSDLTSTTDSSQISTAYSRLQQMSLAYATVGSALRTNAQLAADIQTGLNWMYTNRYNPSAAEYDNWYDWEIGSPLLIVDIGTFMYGSISSSCLSNTLTAMDHFTPYPFSGTSGTSTGGNLTDKLRVVAVRGALVKDAGKLFAAQTAFSSLFQTVTNGDGFYADGSFIQHTHHPYNGSYGLEVINDVALVLPWLVNSPWQVTDPDQTNVVQWVYNSYQPFLYLGAMMDMTRGRAMSRYSDQDQVAGDAVMRWILTLAASPFPAAGDAQKMQGIVKYLAQSDTFLVLTNNIGLAQLAIAEQLMTNTAVTPRGELFAHWSFASMDQMVHLRPGWGLGLCLSSSRVYNYESINSENLKGWFQGDGASYFYVSNDLAQFSNNFWPTVDPYSLTGTTVDTTPLAAAAGQSSLTTKNWVGGVTLFTNGTAGLDLSPVNTTQLSGKKSWFMLPNEVVCLGAGITCSDSADIQTTALNRKISSNNTNVFTVNGTNQTLTLGWTNYFTNTTWCALTGFGGCYFPGGAIIKATRTARTNAWTAINAGGTTGNNTNNFLTLTFDHGVKPANSNYAYVVLPNYSALQASNYALASPVIIVSNTATVQAIKYTNLNIVAANFWQDGNSSADIISVNHKSSVMVQQVGGLLSVAVADPTQTNGNSITVSLNTGAYAVQSADPAINVIQIQPTIQFTVNTSNALGRSFVVTLVTSNSPPTLAALPSTNLAPGNIYSLSISNYANDPNLPYQTLSYTLNSGPTNATVSPVSGQFSWQPTLAQAGTSNNFLVQVSDNGSPSLSATQSFHVLVNPVPYPTISAGGLFMLSMGGSTGVSYSILASTNLSTWSTILTTNLSTSMFNWTDTSSTSAPARFYRVRMN